MHEVAIIALPDFVCCDLATPYDVFSHVQLANGRAGYRVRVCGATREVRTAAFAVRPRWTLGVVASADTVVLPGLTDLDAVIPAPVIAAIRRAARRGARIASICTGAFILAATGLLDGRRATTHWLAAAQLAARFPAVTVDPDVLFVDEGAVISSAGASAALDLCLHLVRRDYGQAVAAQAARLAVAPIDREGGQAQFIRHEAPVSTASLAPLLAWMEANAHRPLALADLARRARTSERTLGRRFKEQTGVTPIQWLLAARTRRAQELLETSALSVEEVAAKVGFEGASTFRDRFRREVGVSPSRYRQAFNAPVAL